MSKWTINPIDGLPHNPDADPNCKTCKGHGVVDGGSDYGCILIDCPTCCCDKTEKGQKMSHGMWTVTTRIKTFMADYANHEMAETAGLGYVTVRDFNTIRTEYEQLLDTKDAEITESKRKLVGYQKECNQVEQVLGEALGYPRYENDQKNFPLATAADGVCIGDHTPGTIAEEAAEQIKQLRQDNQRFKIEIERLKNQLKKNLPDPNKLRVLADWFDMEQQKDSSRWTEQEVQQDLRQWAIDIENILNTKGDA